MLNSLSPALCPTLVLQAAVWRQRLASRLSSGSRKRNRRPILCLFKRLAPLVALTSPSWAGAELPSIWSSTTAIENRVEGNVFRTAPAQKVSTDDAGLSLTGDEEDDCPNKLIRRSAATAKAHSRLLPLAPIADGVTSLELEVFAAANGGGYRTCDLCLATCIGLHPHDTDGAASASANTVTTLILNKAHTTFSDFVVTRTVAGRGALAIEVEDGYGKSLGSVADSTSRITIDTRWITKVVFRAHLSVSASDRGTCCNQSQQAAATIRILIEPTPKLAEANAATPKAPIPYVLGGHIETRFAQVGYVWINDGSSLCTGTLVGHRTVLTAAHCVEGFKGQKIEFLLSNSVQSKTLPDDKYLVTDFDYPQDPSVGPAFDALILADDLALLYLDRDVKDPQKRDALLNPIAVYAGTPSFPDVRSAALTFVGFGYSDIVPGPPPQLTESGSKRSVSMTIEADSRKTFRNKAPGQNTCKGDSGGPALLLRQNQEPVVIGVISAGDALCLEFGNNTRLDAYATWLKDKLK